MQFYTFFAFAEIKEGYLLWIPPSNVWFSLLEADIDLDLCQDILHLHSLHYYDTVNDIMRIFNDLRNTYLLQE